MEQEVGDESSVTTETVEPMKIDETVDEDEEHLKCDEETKDEEEEEEDHTTIVDKLIDDNFDLEKPDSDTNIIDCPPDNSHAQAGQNNSNSISILDATIVEENIVNDSVSTKSTQNESKYSHCSSCNRKQLKAAMIRNGRYCNQQCAHSHATLLRVFKNPLQLPKSNAKKKVMMKDGKLCVGNMGISSHPKVALPKRNGNQNTRTEYQNTISRVDNLDGLDLLDANDEVEDIDQWFDGHDNSPFNWREYLTQTKTFCAPTKCFKRSQLNTIKENEFSVGMKLEGVDPHHPSSYCALTVAEVVGCRLRLHFDGYPDVYDFWVNADSSFIFPVNFCSKSGRKLEPPKDYPHQFNWKTYLAQTTSIAAPSHLFTCLKPSNPSSHPFCVGMKLEAVDKANESLVCVASISDILDTWLLIHFDGWDDSYDYWTSMNSPYIRPVNWCRDHGHPLTPPKDYSRGEKFKWQDYLQQTGGIAAPIKAFRVRPANQFRPGMRLEVVDKRNPRCIRVATVAQRQPHSIKIHLDEWDSKYDFWVDDDTPDIHSVNWSFKNSVPLSPPPSYYRKDEISCLTGFCRGQGNSKSPALLTHSSVAECPYSDTNMDKELPDRLDRFDSDDWVDSTYLLNSNPDSPHSDSNKGRKRRRDYSGSSDSESPKESRSTSPSLLFQNRRNNISSNPNLSTLHQAIFALRMSQRNMEASVAWDRHSRNLLSFANKINATEVLDWNSEEVSRFVSSLPGCEEFAPIFEIEDIDGEAFLLLNQTDLVRLLRIKLGPAVKIFNSILVIRDNMKLES